VSTTILHGDCLQLMAAMPDNSVDAIVTDPPYGLGFMGKAWDDLPPGLPWAQECLRVLKPGGHLLAFGGTRTWHRLACAVEDAGFEVRDSIAWLYGSGFPKSLDVSKAIDKARDDKAEVLAVTSRLADLAAAADITRADIDAHMQTSDMGGWWLSRLPHRCACPSVENWTRLRDLIPGATELDAEVWRLNGRKGSPGEAWQNAEVLRTEDRMNEASGVVNIGQGDRTAVTRQIKAPATPDAERWQGWGTALKPAHEPIVVARKPLVGTVAANVLAWGTGAINVDACRIGREEGDRTEYGRGNHLPHANTTVSMGAFPEVTPYNPHTAGRWPANVVLDQDMADALDQQSGTSSSPSKPVKQGGTVCYDVGSGGMTRDGEGVGYGDKGGASRFFYVAKAPKKERPNVDGTAHPTVKPLTLMRWLVRLVTPPGGTVLEPFAGSGTTVEACVLEGFHCIAIEREADYLPLIEARLAKHHEPDPVAAPIVTDLGEQLDMLDLLDGGAA
jgi:hypothetical protein